MKYSSEYGAEINDEMQVESLEHLAKNPRHVALKKLTICDCAIHWTVPWLSGKRFMRLADESSDTSPLERSLEIQRLLGSRRLALGATSTRTILTSISTNGKTTDASRKEGKGVILGLRAKEIVGRASRCRTVTRRLESSLGRTAVKGASRMRTGSRATNVSIQGRWVRSGSTTNTGRQGVSAGGPAKVLTVAATSSAKGTASRRVRARSRSATNRVRAHTIVRSAVHGGRISRVRNNSGAGSAGTASETANILGKVVVTANLITTLPVASTERDDTATAHATTTMTHTTVMVVVAAVVRRGHHGWSAIAVAAAAAAAAATAAIAAHLILRTTSADSRERTAETSSTSLEIRESAGGASPIARSRAVLAGREWRQDFSSPVKNPAGGGRDLNGLFVQGTSVHAETLSGLVRLVSCDVVSCFSSL
jgi:hypothetical protein